MAKGSGLNFNYRGRDRTVESQKARSRGGSSFDPFMDTDLPMFKPKEGENRIRILPPSWEDTGTWGDGWEIQVWLHRNVGPDNGTYLCLEKNPGHKFKRCPVCEARRQSKDEDERDALAPGPRALAWIIDRDNPREGPQVFSMPYSKVFKEINSRTIDKRMDSVLPIDDPEEGYDITFDREGAQLRTTYGGVDIDREPSYLHEDTKTAQKWLDYIVKHPLPEALMFYEPEYLEKVLFGAVSSKREEEEEDAPSSVRSRYRPRAAADEEEPKASRRGKTEEEGDDEIPWGRGRAAGGRSRAAPAEEEEDTEDDRPRGKLSGRGHGKNGGEEVEEETEEEMTGGRAPVVSAGKRAAEAIRSRRR